MTQELIDNGFKVFTIGFNPSVPKFGMYEAPRFNPRNNWFGCGISEYIDCIFIRDNKEVSISMNGVTTPLDRAARLYPELISKCAIRYVAFKIDDQIIYETFTGEVPKKEFIDNFVK